MNKPLVAALLVVNLLCGVVLGYKISYETCQGQLGSYEAKYSDYREALGNAQQQYDDIKMEAGDWIGRLEKEKILLWDRIQTLEATNEWYRKTLDQRSAEVSRWKSLSNVLGGTAY